jgi:hypothetical protein
VTALIDRHDMETIAEATTEVVPDMRVQPASMHHDHRGAILIAPIQVMEPNPLAFDVVTVDVVEPHGLRFLGG